MNFHSSRYAVLAVVIAVGLVLSDRVNAVNWAKVVAYGSDAENAADVVQFGMAKKKFVDNTWEQFSRTIDGKQSAAEMDKNVWRKSRGGAVYEFVRDMPGAGPIIKIAETAENAKQRITNTFKRAGTAKDNISRTINSKFSWKSRPVHNEPSRVATRRDKSVAATSEKRNYYEENYDAGNPYDPWAPKPEQADELHHIAKSHGFDFSDDEYSGFDDPGTEDTDLRPVFDTPFGSGADGSMTFNITAGENNVLGLPGATGGNGGLTYTVSPGLPSGLVFNSASRTIEGISQAHGTRKTYTLQAMDEDGDTDMIAFHIVTLMKPEKVNSLIVDAEGGLLKQAKDRHNLIVNINEDRKEWSRKNKSDSNALLVNTLRNGDANTFQNRQMPSAAGNNEIDSNFTAKSHFISECLKIYGQTRRTCEMEYNEHQRNVQELLDEWDFEDEEERQQVQKIWRDMNKGDTYQTRQSGSGYGSGNSSSSSSYSGGVSGCPPGAPCSEEPPSKSRSGCQVWCETQCCGIK